MNPDAQTESLEQTETIAVPGWTTVVAATLFGWMVPGLGHLYLGRKVKGLLFCFVILSCFMTGIAIGGSRIVSAADDNKVYAAQVLTGVVGVSFGIHATTVYTPLIADSRWEVGRLYTMVAGLMNLLVMLDLWSIRHRLATLAAQPTPLLEFDPEPVPSTAKPVFTDHEQEAHDARG